jgi:hypothetical protein
MFLTSDYTLELFFWLIMGSIFLIAVTILLSKPPRSSPIIKQDTVHDVWNLGKSNTLYDIEINEMGVLIFVWILFLCALIFI